MQTSLQIELENLHRAAYEVTCFVHVHIVNAFVFLFASYVSFNHQETDGSPL